MSTALERSFQALRAAALAYPETHEDFPWGHSAIKIKTKVFVFLYFDPTKSELTMSTKLPSSSEVALLLPFTAPTGYGLGRSGWVTATFTARDDVPVDMLHNWIDESYRAIAPAKLLKQLATPPEDQATAKKTHKKLRNPRTTARPH